MVWLLSFRDSIWFNAAIKIPNNQRLWFNALKIPWGTKHIESSAPILPQVKQLQRSLKGGRRFCIAAWGRAIFCWLGDAWWLSLVFALRFSAIQFLITCDPFQGGPGMTWGQVTGQLVNPLPWQEFPNAPWPSFEDWTSTWCWNSLTQHENWKVIDMFERSSNAQDTFFFGNLSVDCRVGLPENMLRLNGWIL